jgi:ATP-binding cassette subfamily B protein
MDCGPTCIAIISKYYGKVIDLNEIRKKASFSKEGVNLLGISEASEELGFRTTALELTFKNLIEDVVLPCIVHWNQNHFVVVTPNSNSKMVEVADPAFGIIQYKREEFLKNWIESSDDHRGIALLYETTPEFHLHQETKTKGLNWRFLIEYLKQYKTNFLQIFFSLLITSFIQLIVPFLTQSIVDVGINTKNLGYIYIILFAQIFLFIGRTVTDFIRSYLLLHIGSRVNISILSDFWIKLMKLPISYFDTKMSGDTLQRIGDHSRIQQFLTSGSLSVIFSLINLLIFSIVLFSYSTSVFIVFLSGSTLYFLWIRFFLEFRRRLDIDRFKLSGKENSATLQLVHGMQEIRLNSCETSKRWEWERIQAALFKLSFKGLQISQYQQAGALFINEGKNIIITFFVSIAVINGELTLGAMLAIQYIIGQLNSPVEQLIAFIQQGQDAKISLERLNEIHELDNEENEQHILKEELPLTKTIKIRGLNFTYPGAGNKPVLSNINIDIPENKVTAIVGMSGSGKTTFLKLLLRFYDSYFGEIFVDETNIKDISHKYWRSKCSSVLQEGYIFNDTIANNIALNDEPVNKKQLIHACRVANILDFIENLPLGFNTKIGMEGLGISQGQKQRILIARAVYKNPEYIFFDEATNSLDANNEMIILENLQTIFQNKTVIVVAHRLSTVKNADKILVLDAGNIIEEGTHDTLTEKQGYYYRLVKNQLELGV